VIWSLFTLFSFDLNINGFLTVEQNGTVISMSKRNPNQLIFHVYISEYEDDNAWSDLEKNWDVRALSHL